MVADREMPAWQWTNTLPPAFLMESEKQRAAGYSRAQNNPSLGTGYLKNAMYVLSRDGQCHLKTLFRETTWALVQRTRNLNPDWVFPLSRLILDKSTI
jgi:hypothetical protein